MLYLKHNYAQLTSTTPPKTNSSPLKNMVSNRNLLFQGVIFRCELLILGRVAFCMQFYQLPAGQTRNFPIMKGFFWKGLATVNSTLRNTTCYTKEIRFIYELIWRLSKRAVPKIRNVQFIMSCGGCSIQILVICGSPNYFLDNIFTQITITAWCINASPHIFPEANDFFKWVTMPRVKLSCVLSARPRG